MVRGACVQLFAMGNFISQRFSNHSVELSASAPQIMEPIFCIESMESRFSRTLGLQPACGTRERSQPSAPVFPGQVPSLAVRLSLLTLSITAECCVSSWRRCLLYRKHKKHLEREISLGLTAESPVHTQRNT